MSPPLSCPRCGATAWSHDEVCPGCGLDLKLLRSFHELKRDLVQSREVIAGRLRALDDQIRRMNAVQEGQLAQIREAMQANLAASEAKLDGFQTLLDEALAAALGDSGQLAEAERVLRRFADERPDDPAAAWMLFDFLVGRSRWMQASRRAASTDRRLSCARRSWAFCVAASSAIRGAPSSTQSPSRRASSTTRPPTCGESCARRRARTVPALVFAMVDSTGPRSSATTFTGTRSGATSVYQRISATAAAAAEVQRSQRGICKI